MPSNVYAELVYTLEKVKPAVSSDRKNGITSSVSAGLSSSAGSAYIALNDSTVTMNTSGRARATCVVAAVGADAASDSGR